MSVRVGVGKGAQNGVLIKNAEALELMDKVNALIVDKTGTLTEGKPTVEKIGTFSDSMPENDVLQYIVLLNTNSEHPLTKATIKYGKENHTVILHSENFNAVAGKGVDARIDIKKISL